MLTGAGALSSPEASSYFSPPNPHNVGSNHYLEIVRGAKAAVKIPIIASVNAVSKDSWVEYASQLQEAGADALQLNIYLLPTDISLSGRDIEDRYLNIVRVVKTRVTIPVAVKAGPYFSSPGHMAGELAVAGADGLVLFNLFYQPDIDVVRLKITHDLDLSRSADMRLPLLWIAVLHGRIKASLAATTGVHTTEDVVKYLLAGADVAMTTSALLEHASSRAQTRRWAGGLAGKAGYGRAFAHSRATIPRQNPQSREVRACKL